MNRHGTEMRSDQERKADGHTKDRRAERAERSGAGRGGEGAVPGEQRANKKLTKYERKREAEAGCSRRTPP